MILAVLLTALATLSAVAAVVTSFRGRAGTPQTGEMDLDELAQSAVLRGSGVDVARSRERTRRRRLWRLFLLLAPISAYFYYRIMTSQPIHFGMPSLSPGQMEIFLPLGLIALLSVVLVVPMISAGKSPHVRYDPSEIDVTMEDVVGLGPVRQEVINTLNLFLGYQTFR